VCSICFSVSEDLLPSNLCYPADEETIEKLISAKDPEEASFAVPPNLELEIMGTAEETALPLQQAFQGPSTSIYGKPFQAPVANKDPSPDLTYSVQDGSPPFLFPSPLKRTQAARKHFPTTSTPPSTTTPLVPKLARPLKAKFKIPKLGKPTLKNLVPLMSVRTGIFMRRSRILEILCGPPPKPTV